MSPFGFTRTKAGLLAPVLLLAVSVGWVAAAGKNTARKPVDWPALNPAFAGATFVNNPETCVTCHDEASQGFAHTRHASAFRQGEKPPGGECETCHGPRSKHVENPTGELAHSRLSAKAQSAVCLQCHDSGARFGWKSGPHQQNDVS